MSLHTRWLSESIPYTGAELRPHWISRRTEHFGSAIVAFQGPCRVATTELVDREDSMAGAVIEARQMLHFLGEFFEGNLDLWIVWQRLFVASFLEELRPRAGGSSWERSGNDLFLVDGASRRKLSVSIVTATPVSCLFHFGVNVDAGGAPVPAVGLSELGIDAEPLARAVLDRWSRELVSAARARCKVSPR
ncbi:MAG: DUF366 family protein [Bdellovibrionales bacterium]|nr:DUF366 family protein [Bdellovibrionales bacterium]